MLNEAFANILYYIMVLLDYFHVLIIKLYLMNTITNTLNIKCLLH